MNAFAAFFHHIAFVTIILTLFAEMLLLKEPLTLASAKKIQRYDVLYGISAGLIVVVGILRVMYFEKGAGYYLHSGPFILKMVLFVIVGLLSIYPTKVFLQWSSALKQGLIPAVSAAQNRKLRMIIHLELSLLVLIILCAALMAKGIGYFGA